VCETGVVEVLETLGCTVQLPPHFSEGCGGKSEATYKFQSVGVIVFNELHNIPTRHPLRHGCELAFLHVLLGPNELQDVRVG